MLKIAVFASGRGSNFHSLYNAIKEQHINAEIVVVISNNATAPVLSFAQSLNIPNFYIEKKQFVNHNLFIHKVLEILQSFNINFIVLAGYLKKIPSEIIEKYRNKIINIHPSLLPDFGGKGMYGEHVHKAVLDSGVKRTGATVHFVDEDFDTGKIILQESIEIEKNDTIEARK